MWNGVSILAVTTHNPPDVDQYTDAAGGLGCGWSGRWWFQYFWPERFGAHSIAVKELLIVMACVVWGQAWRCKSVLAHCDNQAVVEVINAGYSKDPHLMQLLRSLFFITAHLEIALQAVHIPGKANTGADAISSDSLILLQFHVPAAQPSSTPLPPPLSWTSWCTTCQTGHLPAGPGGSRPLRRRPTGPVTIVTTASASRQT